MTQETNKTNKTLESPESANNSHFVVKIVNNKTGYETITKQYIDITTYVNSKITSNCDEFKFYDIIKPMFDKLLKQLNIYFSTETSPWYGEKLDLFFKNIDNKINTYDLQEINNIENIFEVNNYTFVICEETFNIINDILLRYKVLKEILFCKQYLNNLENMIKTEEKAFYPGFYTLNYDVLKFVTDIKKIIKKHLI